MAIKPELQQGDILLYQSTDGGDIIYENGFFKMSGGLETFIYLCLFGGNSNDQGGDDTTYEWWGNLLETDKNKKLRSETQYLLQTLPLTSKNLLRIQEAVKRDCQPILDIGAATSLDALASIPDVNKIKIVVSINIEGHEQDFTYIENWKAGIQ